MIAVLSVLFPNVYVMHENVQTPQWSVKAIWVADINCKKSTLLDVAL